MRVYGVYDWPNVRILEGRWQDFIGPEARTDASGQPLVDIGRFDALFYDTFEERFLGFMEFIRLVPGLLRGPSARFSFFHGHGARYSTLYDVTSRVIEWQLNDLGMNVSWTSEYSP